MLKGILSLNEILYMHSLNHNIKLNFIKVAISFQYFEVICAWLSDNIYLYSTDINECLTNNGGCDHTCINTEGSFECLCNTSYILAADNKTCMPNVTDCDYVLDEPSGRISTSGFPNSPYAPNSNCTWTIDLPAYKNIELKFIEMDIEESTNCVKNKVTILNGKDEDAISLGSYCGNKLPAIIRSSTETVIIKFTSDDAINNKGFDLRYRGLKERSNGKLIIATCITL